MTSVVSYDVQDGIAVISIDNPPVNALSQPVRAELQSMARKASNEAAVQAIVVACAGRTFVAGADIREFGKPPVEPLLPDVINALEAIPKPTVAALHGTALGGGLELALGCHYRVATAKARFALPEVTLGLLPGAGGTQRLPRLVSFETAIDMITTGKQIGAREAAALGLVDLVIDATDVAAAAVAFAKDLVKDVKGPRPVSALDVKRHDPSVFDTARGKLIKTRSGQLAPLACVDALEAAAKLPFSEGLSAERKLFRKMMETDQRSALIHAFFSERKVAKLPELEGVDPRNVAQIGVVGGGTMGAGIATSALLAGLDVTLIERDTESAERAHQTVARTLEGSVKRGKIDRATFETLMSERFRAESDYAALSETDLVIEAVFESMEVKKDVFTQLDRVCKPGAVLASNTSYLDINEIAQVTSRPQHVIGLHFFSPAHVMKLLEVVVADQTSPVVTATGFALAKTMRKIAVRAGVCDGFIGNRILSHYRKAVDGTVLAGASPFAVDRALREFGLAMGPFAVSDLAGLDIGWATRKRLAPTRDPRETYAEFADRICEAGRFGRKTGRGFYIYGEGSPTPDPEVDVIIADERKAKGITPRELGDGEIVDRFMAAMVNEAARVVAEGIALRPLDVDVVLLNGYGFPRWRGGPMHYADAVGPAKILEDIQRFAKEDAFLWQPAPLLEKLASEGKLFSSLND